MEKISENTSNLSIEDLYTSINNNKDYIYEINENIWHLKLEIIKRKIPKFIKKYAKIYSSSKYINIENFDLESYINNNTDTITNIIDMIHNYEFYHSANEYEDYHDSYVIIYFNDEEFEIIYGFTESYSSVELFSYQDFKYNEIGIDYFKKSNIFSDLNDITIMITLQIIHKLVQLINDFSHDGILFLR